MVVDGSNDNMKNNNNSSGDSSSNKSGSSSSSSSGNNGNTNTTTTSITTLEPTYMELLELLRETHDWHTLRFRGRCSVDVV